MRLSVKHRSTERWTPTIQTRPRASRRPISLHPIHQRHDVVLCPSGVVRSARTSRSAFGDHVESTPLVASRYNTFAPSALAHTYLAFNAFTGALLELTEEESAMASTLEPGQDSPAD